MDLGSTWTRAALCADGETTELVLGADGERGRSSVVTIGPSDLLAAHHAGDTLIARNTVDEVLLRIGDPTPILLDGRLIPAVEVLAILLRSVLETADADRVVLAVPATWGQYRHDRFAEVAQLAGRPDAIVVSSAEALATMYAREQGLPDGGLVAVFDWGGHSFGCAVLEVSAQRCRILGNADGIERLGGRDLDIALFRHLDIRTGGALSELELIGADALEDAYQCCRQARETLSDRTTATVRLDGLSAEIVQTVSRTELEKVAAPVLDVTTGIMRRTLGSAGIEAADLSAVLVVGGLARMPLVAAQLAEEFGCPIRVIDQPQAANAVAAANWPAASAEAVVTGPQAVGPPSAGRPPSSVRLLTRSRALIALTVMALILIPALVLGQDRGHRSTAQDPSTSAPASSTAAGSRASGTASSAKARTPTKSRAPSKRASASVNRLIGQPTISAGQLPIGANPSQQGPVAQPTVQPTGTRKSVTSPSTPPPAPPAQQLPLPAGTAPAVPVQGIHEVLLGTSSLLVDLPGNSNTIADGTAVQLSTNQNAQDQHWNIDYDGNGFWLFVDAYSGKALAVRGASRSVSAVVEQDAPNTADVNHQWQIRDVGNGLVRIVNRNSGLALQASSASNGAVLVQEPVSSSINQLWRLVAT